MCITKRIICICIILQLNLQNTILNTGFFLALSKQGLSLLDKQNHQALAKV